MRRERSESKAACGVAANVDCGLRRSLLSLSALCSSYIKLVGFRLVGRELSWKLLAVWQLMWIVALADLFSLSAVCSSCVRSVDFRQAGRDLSWKLLAGLQRMWIVAGA